MPFRGNIFSLVLVAIAILSTACWGDDDDEPPAASVTPAGAIATRTAIPEGTSTPRPTATPAATPAPTVEGGIEYNGFQLFGDFTYAAPIEFPENLMLIVGTGCSQCDGPTDALYRVWRNSGETHVELLIDASISENEDAFISSLALRPDLSDIVVAICVTGDCTLGGAGPASITTLYRSRDGGVTWSVERTSEPGQWLIPVAITDEGVVLVEPGHVLRYLDGEVIEPPPGAEDLFAARDAGELLWSASGGSEVLNPDGARLAVVEPGGHIGSLAVRRDARPAPIVAWQEGPPGNTPRGWNITRPTEGYLHVGFHMDDFPQIVAALSNGAVLGRLSSNANPTGNSIAYFDIERGIITPIAGALIEAPFGDGQLARGRNALQAAVEGPFLRITTTTPCVDILADTGTQSEVLTCAVDGVLVQDLENRIRIGAQEWRRVRLLDGREGYAPAESLTQD